MIKTNELRIGNFVSINNGFEMLVHSIFQNDTVYLDFIPPLINESDVLEEDYKDLVAIPLTKEWLLKAGFERLFHTGSTYSLRYFNVSDFGENGIYLYDVKQPIKYVHQLQNLYFAMTGEELVFSTEP